MNIKDYNQDFTKQYGYRSLDPIQSTGMEHQLTTSSYPLFDLKHFQLLFYYFCLCVRRLKPLMLLSLL